jgi:hypothetical protein
MAGLVPAIHVLHHHVMRGGYVSPLIRPSGSKLQWRDLYGLLTEIVDGRDKLGHD